jgi:hypothetical protein
MKAEQQDRKAHKCAAEQGLMQLDRHHFSLELVDGAGAELCLLGGNQLT